MPSYITTYKFNRNDSKYIQAIMTFNPEYRIRSINEIEFAGRDIYSYNYNQFTETNLCKDLLQQLQSIDSEQIILTCQSPITLATTGVFPKVDPNQLEQTTEDLLITPKRYHEMEVFIEHSDNYIQWVLKEENTEINKWNLECRALGLIGGRREFNEYTGINTLNRKEAFIVLRALMDTINITSAINILATKQILFQTQGINFILSYNNGLRRRPSLCKARPFALDINKGFVSLEDYDPWIIDKGHDQDLINALQTFFLTWKENGFEGPLFSSDMLSEHTETNEDIAKEDHQNTTPPGDTTTQISEYIQRGTLSFTPSIEPVPDYSDSAKRLFELSMFTTKGPCKYDARRKMPYYEIKLDEMPERMKTLFLSHSIKQIMDNNSEKTVFIKNNEITHDILNQTKQVEWLNQNKNYDFYQLALEKNKFALQAIFQNLLDDRDNEEKLRKVLQQGNIALFNLAKKGYIDAVDLLLYSMFLSPSAAAYGYTFCDQGYYSTIGHIEALLNKIHEHHFIGEEVTSPMLNETIDAAIKGFEENGYFEDIDCAEYAIDCIKDPLLLQKFSEKMQELNLYRSCTLL